MNGLEITKILQSISHVVPYILGVIPQEELPSFPHTQTGLLVINTRNHWVTIYIPSNGPLEFFDSLGNEPPPIIKEYIGNYYVYNGKEIQSNNSTTCGAYCVLYGCLRLAGISMNDIIDLFSPCLHENDQMVVEYLKILI